VTDRSEDVLLGPTEPVRDTSSDIDGNPRGELGEDTPDDSDPADAPDPATAMPVDSPLAGLTNVDGAPLPAGPDHLGIGDDPLLGGTSGPGPTDVQRDPLGGAPEPRSGYSPPASGEVSTTTTTTEPAQSSDNTEFDRGTSTDSAEERGDQLHGGDGMINPDADTFHALTQDDLSGAVPRQADVTDVPRGDLDNGLGPVTHDLVGSNTAGPDVNPDSDVLTGGPLTSVDAAHLSFESGTGAGVVDGPRPDLDSSLGAIAPPEHDGINPYADGQGDGSGERGSFSSADTADDGTDAGGTSIISLVGAPGTGGGIQSVDGSDVVGMDHASQALDSAGGDDDDLDELQVERSTSQPADVGAALPDDTPPLSEPTADGDPGLQLVTDVMQTADAVPFQDVPVDMADPTMPPDGGLVDDGHAAFVSDEFGPDVHPLDVAPPDDAPDDGGGL